MKFIGFKRLARSGLIEPGARVVAVLTGHREKVAALSVATPDPAKFVSIDVMQDLQGRVAALSQLE